MADTPENTPREDRLNPSLKKRSEVTHDTTRSTPPPAESASVRNEEGRVWPVLWAVVVVAGMLVALWILL